MRLLPALVLVLACRSGGAPAPSLGGDSPDTAAIRRDVEFLASDALEGRGTGTTGNDDAAAYVARRFAALGLSPVRGARHGGVWYQPFTVPAAAPARPPSTLPTRNVVALAPGSDPALRHQYVVVGAHFDHLGRSPENAFDRTAGDAIRNGADDNASGTAALLELARLVARRPTRRTVIFAAFSGEELGRLGSRYFVQHPPVPLDSVQAMLNFDMVGRLRDSRLTVHGVATAAELPALLDSAGRGLGLRVSAVGDGSGPSDHASFSAMGVPVLHFFTDLHDDYHRATDDAGAVDAAGEARVLTLAERVLRDIADRPGRLTRSSSDRAR